MANGDQSGTWGSTTNTNLGTLLEQAIVGVQPIVMVDADYTLTNFNGASDEARNAVLVVTGTNSAIRNIITPSGQQKTYIVSNGTAGGFAINIKAGAGGIPLAINSGITEQVYTDGTNFYQVGMTSFNGGTTGLTPSTLASGDVTLGGTLNAASGGTGLSSPAANSVLLSNGSSALQTVAPGTSGYILTSNGTTWVSAPNGGIGVSSVGLSAPSIFTVTGSPVTSTGTLTLSYSGSPLPVANGGTGITAFGTGVATALGVNVGSAGAFVTFNGDLGTPSSGTVTNLTGTASININGTVGATTANTGAFTTLSASSTVSGTGFSTYLASPPAIGGTTAAAGSFTTLSASSTVSGTGFSTYLASPPAIGGTAAAAGTFTALVATSITDSGLTSGRVNYATTGGLLTNSANMTFDGSTLTTLNSAYTGTLTGGTGIVNLGSGQFYKDASGNVGIGTSSPSKKFEVYAASNSLQIESIVRNDQAGSGVAAIGFNVSSSGASETTSTKAGIGLVRSASYGVGSLCFYNNATTSVGDFTTADERMRIDSSGNLLVGTSASLYSIPQGVAISGAGIGAIVVGHASGTTTGNGYINFNYNASAIGSITQNGTTGVLYNITSDYRLKTDAIPLKNALLTIEALNPVSFTWIDGRPDDGFLAHELQAVIPNCVTGEKDAVNEDGTPKYQQMDNSGVIPFLVKAIQEQQDLITNLQTRLTKAGL